MGDMDADGDGGVAGMGDAVFSVADLRSDVRLIKWSQGIIIGGIVAILVKVYLS